MKNCRGRARLLAFGVLGIGALTALGPSGCSERQRLTSSVDEPVDWRIDEPRRYPVPEVPQATVHDSVTGETFRLPAGGGVLSVARITGGPEIDPGDSAFEIDHTGSGPVQILVDHAQGDLDAVFAYRSFDDVIREGTAFETAGWVPLADSTFGPGTLLFELRPMPQAAMRGDPARPGVPTRFRRIRVSTSALYGVKYAQFEGNIQSAIDDLLLAVAEHRRPQVQRAITGHLKYKLHLRERAKISPEALPCYAPFWRDDLRLFVTCTLMMIDDSGYSVAHETGHYFHHVLVGTEFYQTFHGLPEGHGIGRPGAKNNLIEEPAYFAEYYLKGLVGNPGGANPERGTFLTAGGTVRPSTSDFTGLEGFGVALLASLTRDGSEITDFTGQRVPVPVVSGERMERFQAVFEIIASGANSVVDLRQQIEAYLFRNESQDVKMPAMFEPLGWSHHVDCLFVNSEREPVPGVRARPISKVGTVTYWLPEGRYQAGEDGLYLFDRVFPGASHLRVYHGDDSLDVAIEAGWSHPTNEKLHLNEIVVGADLLALLQQQPSFQWVAWGLMADPSGGAAIDAIFSLANRDPGGQDPAGDMEWDGRDFGCEYTSAQTNGEYTRSVEWRIEGRVSADAGRIEVLKSRTRNYMNNYGFIDENIVEVEVRDLRLVGHPGDRQGNQHFVFKLASGDVPANVVSASRHRNYGGNITSTDQLLGASGDWQLICGP